MLGTKYQIEVLPSYKYKFKGEANVNKHPARVCRQREVPDRHQYQGKFGMVLKETFHIRYYLFWIK